MFFHRPFSKDFVLPALVQSYETQTAEPLSNPTTDWSEPIGLRAYNGMQQTAADSMAGQLAHDHN